MRIADKLLGLPLSQALAMLTDMDIIPEVISTQQQKGFALTGSEEQRVIACREEGHQLVVAWFRMPDLTKETEKEDCAHASAE